VVEDQRQIDLPGDSQGPFRVLVGLYEPATGQRLPASGDGQGLPDNAVELAIP
jgi:hypothetical protein